MTANAFCPQCGQARLGTLRFCAHCGFDFWKAAEGQSGTSVGPAPLVASAEGTTPGTAAQQMTTDSTGKPVVIIAGIAFILAGAALGYLAFLQLQYASLGIADSESAGGLAIWNLVAAGLSALAGGKALVSPTRRSLITGAIWGGLNVILGGLQISQGVTHESFVIATICFGIAGILAAVGASQFQSIQAGGGQST